MHTFILSVFSGGDSSTLVSQLVQGLTVKMTAPVMNLFPCMPQSSPLCVAAIHAGVVSNAVGGRISVVSSKGIHHYEATLANNVTSTG